MFWRHQTLSANDCALIVAIPLDRDEFVADLDAQTDFLREYSAMALAYGQDPWTAYHRHAQRYCEAIEVVQGHGVAITRRATLGQFAEAADRYRVVTLVAHSRGPDIHPRDILDAAALVAHGAAIASQCSDAREPPEGETDRTHVAAWLNAALGPVDVADDAPETRAFAWRVALYGQRWSRRRMIEALCPGALAGGPSIEFHDGLKSIDEVSAVFPQRFHTLDLTVCDSVLLAERLRMGRPHGVILANARPTTPDFRLALYRETIRIMTSHGTGYYETAIQLRRHLRQ